MPREMVPHKHTASRTAIKSLMTKCSTQCELLCLYLDNVDRIIANILYYFYFNIIIVILI